MGTEPDRILLAGSAGSGKSTFLRERFMRADPQQRMLLLPTASMVRHVRDLLCPDHGSAVLDGGLHTLLDLSLSIVSRHDSLRFAGDALCQSCMRRVLESGERELEPLTQAAQFPGLARTALRWLREIRQAGLEPEALRRSSRPHGRAMAALYELYQAQLDSRRLVDLESAIALAARRLAQGDRPCLELLAVDGFYEFTQLQSRLLRQLIDCAQSCVVSLVDPRGRRFETLERTRNWLLSIDFTEQRLDDVRRFRSTALRVVESGLFAQGADQTHAGQGIELYAAADPEDEAMWVARDIARRRVAGEPYTSFLVVRRSLHQCAADWRRAFDEVGVPLDVLAAAPLSRHQAISELCGLYRCLVDDLNAMPWALAARGLDVPDCELSDLVELWMSIEPPQTLERAAALEGLEQLPTARAALELLVGWSRRLREAASARAAFEVLDAFAAEVAVAGAIKLYTQSAHEDHLLRAAALTAARSALADLAAWSARDAEGSLDPRRLVESAISQFEHSRLSLQTRRSDAVRMVDALEARNWEADCVYFTGLTQQEFPPRVFDDALLGDEERSRISGVALKTAEGRMDEERLLFYLAATRAAKRMVLCYPQRNVAGVSQTRAFWLEDLLALFEQSTIVRHASGAGRMPLLDTATIRRDVLRGCADAVGRRRAGLHPDQRLLAAARGLADRDSGFRNLLQRSQRRGRAALSRPQTIFKLRELVEPLSPSRADDLAQCPFRFFCAKLLRLKPPARRPAFDNLAEGAVIHEVLREVFQHQAFSSWPDLLDRQLDRALRRFGHPDDPARVRMRLLSALNVTIREEQERIEAGGAEPVGFEQEFGTAESTACAIEVPQSLRHRLPAPELTLHGRIDRVDVIQGELGRVGLVVDYKLSKMGWNERRKRVESGLDNQPAIYLLALRHAFNVQPGGMFYVGCYDGRRDGIYAADRLPEGAVEPSSKTFVMNSEQLDQWLDQQQQRLIELVARAYGGQILARPARMDRCGAENCPFADVCRYRPQWEGEAQ
ncbi:MAG: PD-(D/E)XK nuclease family protein [Candidatus Alcyoniella australis]|nr:PD-(D/E)XK nuclease family protein [Candidatus Alcyoniella australis]